MANTSNLVFRETKFPTNNIIRVNDSVWYGNANREFATTTANLWYANTQGSNIYVQLSNLQNAANQELDFEYIEIGDIIYTSNSPVTQIEYLTQDWIIYLRPPKDQNGFSILDTCHGFQPGDLVCQEKPAEYVSFVLTEEEYRLSNNCNVCGCLSCGCETIITEEQRTILIEVNPAETVSATVVSENCTVPYILVTKATGRFVNGPNTTVTLCDCLEEDPNFVCDDCGCLSCDCKDEAAAYALKYTPSTPYYEKYNTSSYCITAEIVGVYAPLETVNWEAPYIIEQPGEYHDDCYDWCIPAVEGANCINFGLYDGAHIGIDKHFTEDDTQDYTDEYIIISNWDITRNNVPIGRVLDLWTDTEKEYRAMSMEIELIACDPESSMFLLECTGVTENSVPGTANSQFNVRYDARTTLTTYQEKDSNTKLFSVENWCDPVFLVTENCTYSFVHTEFKNTLHTAKYSDGGFSYIEINNNTSINIELSQAHTFIIKPANSTYSKVNGINLIKPEYRGQDRSYSCTLVFSNVSTTYETFSSNTWNTSSTIIQWPGGISGTDFSANQVLHFLNYDSANTIQNKTWYAFNPHTSWPSQQIIDPEEIMTIISITDGGDTPSFFPLTLLTAEVDLLRSLWPVRPFYLLVPRDVPYTYVWNPSAPIGGPIIPQILIDDPYFHGAIKINNDYGDSDLISDWYSLCNLQNALPGSTVAVVWRQSGAMNPANWDTVYNNNLNIRASFDYFIQRVKERRLRVCWIYSGVSLSDIWISQLSAKFQTPVPEARDGDFPGQIGFYLYNVDGTRQGPYTI